MVDVKSERPQLSLAQLKPLLAALAVALTLAALWIGWNAWQQHRDEGRRHAVTQARDEVVTAVAEAVAAEQARFAARLADPAVTAAVAAGDPAAGARLVEGWPGAEEGSVLPADLEAAYAALPDVGYGRLAVMEAALAADAPVGRVVRESGRERLALAAPVRAGDAPVAVALVYLPAQQVLGPVQGARVADDSYLALRQGAHSVVERGDSGLSGGAEVLARPVEGTGLRVVAAVPYVAGAPFGLGPTGGYGLALALLVLALATWRGPQLARRGRTAEDATADGEEALPLSVLAAMDPDPPQPPEGEPMNQTPAVAGPAAGEVAVDPGIFRAYDIRGVVGATLSPQIAELIGQAIGTVMHEQDQREIVVGRDGRLSGPELAAGLVAGLRRAGRNVIDIGLAPTPLTYFGAYHLRAGSCVSVTGSHNPPDYNGFKIVVGDQTLSGAAITDLYERIAAGRLHTAPAPGGLETRDINDDYIERVAADIQIGRPLKVVVDAGNGVAGELGPKVLTAIGAEVVPLYCEIDGTFPNHHPDPSEPHNLADLVQMVERLDADLGIAFDGDGDRLGVVTADGHNIFPDRLLMLFAADVLDRNPGAQIIFDVKCTGRLPGYVLRHGGSPLMWKTGHSLIKAKMRETDAELAGEMSGQFFFKERWYGFDDGIYAAARLLEVLAANPDSPSAVLDALPDGVSTPEIKVEAPAGDPHAFVARFVEQARFEGARLSTIDGLRVDWAEGWGLVRASNTTPVLVLRFDADDAAAMARIQAAFREQLHALDPALPLPF